MGHPVVHFEIVGRDAEALLAYYGELFGWSFDRTTAPGYALIGGGGIGGGVGGCPEYGGHVTVYVEVPDVGAALARAESLGGTRRMGPDRVAGGVVIGQFLDPEGHLLGLITSPSAVDDAGPAAPGGNQQ